jgi:hypothetical protein
MKSQIISIMFLMFSASTVFALPGKTISKELIQNSDEILNTATQASEASRRKAAEDAERGRKLQEKLKEAMKS